jgi:hypothetical protein
VSEHEPAEVTPEHQAQLAMASRVVAVFRRVTADKRPLCRMELPQEDMDAMGITDLAWGIPCSPGPCLAVYGFNMDREELSPDDLVRYEEEPA